MENSQKTGLHIHADHGPCFNYVRQLGSGFERVTAIIYPEIEKERIVYTCSAKCFNLNCKLAKQKDAEEETPGVLSFGNP